VCGFAHQSVTVESSGKYDTSTSSLLVLSSNPVASIEFGAYLVVMPFVDHAFSVSFQNTHAGMGVGHTAVAVPSLPSHSTSTSLLAGPGQLISLVLRLPRGQLTV
jgi:hypothetical protein